MALRLSSSRPAASSSSKENSAFCSSVALPSSRSANAQACIMLTSVTKSCLRLFTSGPSASECLQNAMRELAASYHSAAILRVDVQPSQKRVYAWDVLKTTKKPTRKVKLLHIWAFSRTPSSMNSVLNVGTNFITDAMAEHGSAIFDACRSTLPWSWKRDAIWEKPRVL